MLQIVGFGRDSQLLSGAHYGHSWLTADNLNTPQPTQGAQK
jgi:hypothetical protein